MIYSVSREKLSNIINSFLVALFFIIDLFLQYTGNSIFQYMEFLLIFVLLLKTYKLNASFQFRCMYFLCLYTLMLISCIKTENISIFGCIFNLRFFALTFLMTQMKGNSKVFLSTFYIYFIFFISKLLQGIDPNFIFINSSRNIVSALSINQVLIYYFFAVKNNDRILIHPSILNLLLCLLTFGRSGILIGVSIFCVVFCYIFFTGTKKRKFFYLLFIIAIIFFIYNYVDFAQFRFFERFHARGLESTARDDILLQYDEATSTDVLSLLFGVRIDDYSIFRFFDRNLHNSFLTLHCYFGLLGFVIVFALLFYTFFIGFFTKEYFLCSILGLALIRIFVDIIAFPGIYDGFIFSCSFYILSKYKKLPYLFSSKIK